METPQINQENFAELYQKCLANLQVIKQKINDFKNLKNEVANGERDSQEISQ